ncbi:iron ABC transporter permease, partial [bacterium]|nr:iron ABC transporter permease [bacterium]
MFPRTLRYNLNGWTVATGLVALTLTIPVLYVVARLFDPAGNAWTQVVAGLLPNYAFNSLTLLFGVGALTLLIGTP